MEAEFAASTSSRAPLTLAIPTVDTCFCGTPLPTHSDSVSEESGDLSIYCSIACARRDAFESLIAKEDPVHVVSSPVSGSTLLGTSTTAPPSSPMAPMSSTTSASSSLCFSASSSTASTSSSSSFPRTPATPYYVNGGGAYYASESHEGDEEGADDCFWEMVSPRSGYQSHYQRVVARQNASMSGGPVPSLHLSSSRQKAPYASESEPVPTLPPGLDLTTTSDPDNDNDIARPPFLSEQPPATTTSQPQTIPAPPTTPSLKRVKGRANLLTCTNPHPEIPFASTYPQAHSHSTSNDVAFPRMSTDSEFTNDFGCMTRRPLDVVEDVDAEDRSRTPRSWDVQRSASTPVEVADPATRPHVPLNVSKDLPLAPGERALFGGRAHGQASELHGDAVYYRDMAQLSVMSLGLLTPQTPAPPPSPTMAPRKLFSPKDVLDAMAANRLPTPSICAPLPQQYPQGPVQFQQPLYSPRDVLESFRHNLPPLVPKEAGPNVKPEMKKKRSLFFGAKKSVDEGKEAKGLEKKTSTLFKRLIPTRTRSNTGTGPALPKTEESKPRRASSPVPETPSAEAEVDTKVQEQETLDEAEIVEAQPAAVEDAELPAHVEDEDALELSAPEAAVEAVDASLADESSSLTSSPVTPATSSTSTLEMIDSDDESDPFPYDRLPSMSSPPSTKVQLFPPPSRSDSVPSSPSLSAVLPRPQQMGTPKLASERSLSTYPSVPEDVDPKAVADELEDLEAYAREWGCGVDDAERAD